MAGAFIKIVDEMEDTHILEEYKEYAKTLCTLFSTLWFYNDSYVSLIYIACVIPASLYVNQIDTVYWKTLVPMPFITFLLKMNTMEYLETTDIVQRIIFAVGMFGILVFEDKLIPEETSIRKIVSRVCFIMLALLTINLTSELPSGAFIKTCMLYIIGYCSVSVISKTFFTQIPEASLIEPTHALLHKT